MTRPTITTAISPAESDALEALARDRRVLEIGAQFGFSTVIMAMVARSVVSIDWHRGDPHAGFLDSLWTYRDNLKRNAVEDRVLTVIGPSHQALPVLAPNSFDLIFHDASHDYKNVLDDLGLALRLMDSGYVAVHDYGRFDGLTTACHEVLGQPSQVIDTLAVFRLPYTLDGLDILANS